MKQIQQKLRSRNGATITYALLLFLVCAVIGSVVLTAGTAAAGRLSSSVEMDRRYFSVTSAANLLTETFCDHPVTIVRSREETVVEQTCNEEITTVNEAGETVTTLVPRTTKSDPVIVMDRSTKLDGAALPAEEDSRFLTARALHLMYGETIPSPTASCRESGEDYALQKGNADSGTLTLAFSPATEGLTDVAVTYEMQADGTLRFTITGEEYRLRLTLAPDIHEEETDKKQTTQSEDGSTATTVRTLTKTAEIRWVPGGVEKIVSAPAATGGG